MSSTEAFENIRSRSVSPLPSSDDGRIKRLSNEYLKPNIGILYLLISNFFNSIMVVSTKLLETDPELEVPIKPLQILVVRMLFTVIGAVIYMYLNKTTISHVPFGPPKMRKWLILRGCVGFFGVFGMYYSLMYLSVPDATVILFLGPSFTGFLAWIILRERYSVIEAVGGLISLFGVILIVRPTFLFGPVVSSEGSSAESSNPHDRLIATLVALFGTLNASNVWIVIRYIGRRAHAIMSVTYFSFITFIISLLGILLIPSMTFQIPQTSKQWFLFLVIGFSGFFMQLSLTLGIQRERAGRGSFVAYTQMIYALIWDSLIWHHLPEFWSWCGITIIIGSAVTVLRCKPKPEASPPVDTESNQEAIQMEDFEIDDELK
ncbi:LAFE_0E05358g1_1 [Lachancea fermentati]|uniref:LAFE_0E05358g1_1 n=1 Tax=Lachancea fermentati TaxID=4955 RepID=A0A1G4MD31_LACFM|nr:LAFE_0E05358g1_1 [Lachancea fermentati]